jgi:hypothetical protein
MLRRGPPWLRRMGWARTCERATEHAAPGACPTACACRVVLQPGLQVQLAIEHNRKVFANRVRQEDKAIVKKAFDAWRAAK